MLETAAPLDISTQVDALIQLVGTRVRATRKGLRMSRRELSERSGVSARYLAQLESGQGNISIGLLLQVAMALDTSIEALVASDDPIRAKASHVAAQFHKADRETQSLVLQTLNAGTGGTVKANRICLIGLRGAGKSTLGARIARDFDMPFVELNAAIEERTGIPLGEIIALYGEDGYRQLETETLERLIATHTRIVMAVGGGIVTSPHTFQSVLMRFHTVWIKAQPAEHMDRVRAQGDLRPMAGNPQAMTQLHQILKTREVLYSRAGYQLDTSGKTVQASHHELKELLRSHDVPSQQT